jgi:hypothetical protein
MKKLTLVCLCLSFFAYNGNTQDNNPNIALVTDSCYLSPLPIEWQFSDSLIIMCITGASPWTTQIDTVPVLSISTSPPYHNTWSRKYETEVWGPIAVYYSTLPESRPVAVAILVISADYFSRDGEMHSCPVIRVKK